MSLLHEAGDNIRTQRIHREAFRMQQEEEDRMRPQREEQARRDKEERDRVSADIINQAEGLLEDHGVDPEADRHKGILGKVRASMDLAGKELVTPLIDDEGESISVNISSRLNPKKSSISIHIQGISSYLVIPEDRQQPVELQNSVSKTTTEDLMRYREVVDMVIEKIGFPAPSIKMPQGDKPK